MAVINKKYILMCDEVRQENNGKLFIIGLYTPDIAVTQLPVVIGLTFFICLDSDTPGAFGFKLKLEQLDTGAGLAEGMGVMQFAKVGEAISIVRIPVQFTSAGAYVFSVQINGQRDPITREFQIIMNVPAVAPQAGTPGMPGMPRLGM